MDRVPRAHPGAAARADAGRPAAGSTDEARGQRLTPPRPPHIERLPPPTLPWLYFALAHLCLLLGLAALAIDPALPGGFYYHPKALALVHLVTLGWISGNIVGSLYLVGPAALRCAFPARRLDALAFAAFAIGASGMVTHFWIDEYNGMVWSAWTLLLGLALVGWRVIGVLRSAPVPAAVKAHVILAFANILLAGLLGSLLGLEKTGAITIPGGPLAGVYAHAHLAALGWPTLLVFGLGYRLLPMQLPAAMPAGASLWSTVVLLELGVLGLATSLLLDYGPGAWLSAALCLGAVVAFLGHVAWMLRHRRPTPRGLVRPDPTAGHTMQALGYLLLLGGMGLWLLASPASEAEIRLMFVYGTLGLLGFLGQIILGVGARLLPLSAWMQRFVTSGFEPVDVAPTQAPLRSLQLVQLVAWSLGVPALALGLAYASTGVIRIAALALLVAAGCDGVNRLRAWSLSRGT